jgi:hypothetical protein
MFSLEAGYICIGASAFGFPFQPQLTDTVNLSYSGLSCNGLRFEQIFIYSLFLYALSQYLPQLQQSLIYQIFFYIAFHQHSLIDYFPPLYHFWQKNGQFTVVKVCLHVGGLLITKTCRLNM